MISGAAGAMTVVMGDLTSDHGPLRHFARADRVEQLSMCVILIGALMMVLAPLLCAFVKVRMFNTYGDDEVTHPHPLNPFRPSHPMNNNRSSPNPPWWGS